MTYQAYVHVWTPDYRYWNPVGEPCATAGAAQIEIIKEADRFWPDQKNPQRRAAFLSRCKVIGPDLPPLPKA